MRKPTFTNFNTQLGYQEAELVVPQKPKYNYRSSTLLLVAFATCFYARLLSTYGVPQVINFVHFVVVPLASLVAILQTRTKQRSQIEISHAFLIGLVALFAINLASALLNKAGFINVVLEFLLLCEPFLILLAITCLPLTPKYILRFRKWITIFALSNLVLALFQRYVLNIQNSRDIAGWDLIQGVFYFSGSGHVVSSSVSLCFAVYYFASFKTQALWIRALVVLGAIWQVIESDTKQVFLVAFIAIISMVLLKLNNIIKLIQYVTIFIVGAAALYWAANNIYDNTELVYWVSNIDLVKDGLELKFSVFSFIISYYHSSLNWIIGLGPGHTIGRLGGWMIRDYYSLLQPLGVTQSQIGETLWRIVGNNPLGDKSSMWSPFFGWAGIWGDLGIAGLLAYIYIWVLSWKYFCVDDISKFIALTIFINGAIFTQMEEPGYMLFVCILIGLRWQEHRALIPKKAKI
ncbi:MAG: hypothetical protein IGS39_23410 [Calothrix sp. C42_A2020_038]|nr:hypothetical protein [Calothrix sp. C42_A2020_038]